MSASATFPRRILVCATGLTPQVVTETVYALSQQGSPWVPTEVHIVTTMTGAKRAEELLLPPGRDWFGALCTEYGLSNIQFDTTCIHVVSNADGELLDDIRDQTDNLAVADAILKTIASFCRDPDSAVHVSLAGGRKSMGFFAGYALSLYGRPQDELSHVLVSPGFEANPDFFFPPKTPQSLHSRDNKLLSTADARVELAEIPFVRLRDDLPPHLLDGGSFVEAVTAAQRLQAPAELRIDTSARSIECGGTRISMSSNNFAVYAWHTNRAVDESDPGVELTAFNAVDSALRRELFEFGCNLYSNAMSSEGSQWRDRAWADDNLDHGQWLAECRSRINRSIRSAIGETGERIYGIRSQATTGRSSKHLLDLPAQAIAYI